MDDDIPYLLLTPGPLTTTRTVKQVMLQDFCTWDDDYNCIVTDIRQRLVRLATDQPGYTSVLMQGSGTFTVEATLGSVVPRQGKVLVVNNGAYGARIALICQRLEIDCVTIEQQEDEPADPVRIDDALAEGGFSHLAVVHCETTTGMLNPVVQLGAVARRHHVKFIVDAMSSFGGIPMTIEQLQADFLISSSNKCIQGVPGFGFVIAARRALEETQGRARSLSLDLFDQWREMEEHGGKWRFTSPTHVVRAFAQALDELDEEGGVAARHQRYCDNHRTLVAGMRSLGYETLVAPENQSPIITSFLYPADNRFSFDELYQALKARRFVIYPGKVSHADTFRIGTIGNVYPEDIRSLVDSLREVVDCNL